jgi:hypothetical protein
MKSWLFCLLCILLLSAGCGVKKFEYPTWDVNVNMPLMNEYYYVSDLAQADSEHFHLEGNQIFFTSNGVIDGLSISELTIEPNSSVVAPLIINHTFSGAISMTDLSLTNNVEIAYGEILSGMMNVHVSGLDPAFQNADLTFTEITRSNGQPFSVSINRSPANQVVNLAGLRVGQLNNAATFDSLHFTVSAHASQTENTNVGEVELVLNQPMSFSTIRGFVHNYRLDIESSTAAINIEYPLGMENAIQVHDASLSLSLNNEVGFESELHGILHAYNDSTGQQRTASLLDDSGHPFVLQAAHSPGETATSSFVFHNGLDSLVAIMPTRITLENAYFIMRNDDSHVGFASVGEKAYGTYVQRVPFHFTLFAATIEPKKVTEISVSEKNRKRIAQNLEEADLDLKVTNRLPIGATLTVVFSTSEDVFAQPMLERSATVNAGGEGSVPENIQFHLSNSDLQLFTNEHVFMRSRIMIQPSGGPVQINASSADFIQITGRINLKVLVEEDES